MVHIAGARQHCAEEPLLELRHRDLALRADEQRPPYQRLTVRGLGILTTTGDTPSGVTPGFGGTSSATPLTAGVAALVISANPTLTALEVISILKRTASKDVSMDGYPRTPSAPSYDLDTSWDVSPVSPFNVGAFTDIQNPDGTWSPWFGYGRVDASAAVTAAINGQTGGQPQSTLQTASTNSKPQRSGAKKRGEAKCGLSSVEQILSRLHEEGRAMPNEFLVGAWTYRSFLNLPDPVDDFNKLRFGQGELTFEAASEPGALRGQLAFRSDPPEQADARLLLQGSIQTGNPFLVRFQGTGIPGTSAAGWVYDYVGYFVPDWPNGKSQQAALVGTVIRTVPHGDRPAGVVGSFIAVQRDMPEPRIVIPLPDTVRDMLASKHHRLHHTVWHGTRGMWSNDLSDEQKKQIRDLGWQPGGKEERPATLNETPWSVTARVKTFFSCTGA